MTTTLDRRLVIVPAEELAAWVKQDRRFTAEYVAWLTDLETHERARAALQEAGTDGRSEPFRCPKCAALLPGVYLGDGVIATVAVRRIFSRGTMAIEIAPNVRTQRKPLNWKCAWCGEWNRVFPRRDNRKVRCAPPFWIG